MRIAVNGKSLDLDREMSVAEFLRERGLDTALVAAEHNSRLVSRDDWSNTLLRENDRLEIIRIVAGG